MRRGLYDVSIHAPAWGATSSLAAIASVFESFNPRARVGRDVRHLGRRGRVAGFNPRARVGRDFRCHSASQDVHKFQSTRPRGARRFVAIRNRPRRSFNPRARVGRDNSPGAFFRGTASFNPRARVGRDISKGLGPTRPSCFNPRARVGRDRMSLIIKNFVRLQNRFRRTSPSGA